MCSCHVAHILLREADAFLFTRPYVWSLLFNLYLVNVIVYENEQCQPLLRRMVLQSDDDQRSVATFFERVRSDNKPVARDVEQGLLMRFAGILIRFMIIHRPLAYTFCN